MTTLTAQLILIGTVVFYYLFKNLFRSYFLTGILFHNYIDLEGKDEFIYVHLEKDLFMAIHKKKSHLNHEISQSEYWRIKSISELMGKEPFYLKILRKYNQYSFIENLYFKLA